MNGLVYWCTGLLQDPGHAERFVRVTGKADTTYAVVDHNTVANIVAQGNAPAPPARRRTRRQTVYRRKIPGPHERSEMAEVVGIRTNHTETAMGSSRYRDRPSQHPDWRQYPGSCARSIVRRIPDPEHGVKQQGTDPLRAPTIRSVPDTVFEKLARLRAQAFDAEQQRHAHSNRKNGQENRHPPAGEAFLGEADDRDHAASTEARFTSAKAIVRSNASAVACRGSRISGSDQPIALPRTEGQGTRGAPLRRAMSVRL